MRLLYHNAWAQASLYTLLSVHFFYQDYKVGIHAEYDGKKVVWIVTATAKEKPLHAMPCRDTVYMREKWRKIAVLRRGGVFPWKIDGQANTGQFSPVFHSFL